MIQAKSTGLEDVKATFLQIIHKNITQLTSFMRNELSLPSSYDEEILGRQVAKTIAFMSFDINPMQIDINPDDTINQFLKSSNTLKNVEKYKNYRFYKILKDNNDAIAACFGVYAITRLETIKGFSFRDILNTAGSAAILATTGVPVPPEQVGQGADLLGNLYSSIDSMFGAGDNGKDLPGGIYYFWKYFKGNPKFGEANPTKEQISIGYYKSTWRGIVENESGLSFDVATQYFLKYYPYIKSGYYTTQNELWQQTRKDLAAISNGQAPKTPANVGGITAIPKRRSFLSRLFGR